MAYATCTDCNVTFNVPEPGQDDVLCQRCGGVTHWLVPPDGMTVADSVGDSLLDDTIASPGPDLHADAIEVHTSNGTTDGEIHRQIPRDAPPSAPRDSATRRIESDAGIDQDTLGEPEDPSTMNMFRQPVPPMPKLAAPTIRGDKPVSRPVSAPSKPTNQGRSFHFSPLLAISLSALVGGLLAWVVSQL